MTNLAKLTFGYRQLAKEEILDNYAWHKKAWTLFEHHRELKKRNAKPEGQRGPAPFLTRYTRKSDYAQLLIVSEYCPLKPDWCGSEQWQLIEINENYLSQKNYYFDLYANPTRAVKKPDGKGGFTRHGRRLTLMDKPSQKEWLMRKGDNHGFRLDDDMPLRIEKPVNHYFNRKGKRGLHIGVQFKGAFHVTNRAAFQKAFREGIGTAKGFGFGLLMIKPAQI